MTPKMGLGLVSVLLVCGVLCEIDSAAVRCVAIEAQTFSRFHLTFETLRRSPHTMVWQRIDTAEEVSLLDIVTNLKNKSNIY